MNPRYTRWAILIIAVLLRAPGIETRGLWLDEFTSIEVAGKSLYEIAFGIGFNSHTPPFYYLLLHGWLKFFGTGELALRSLSLGLDLALIALAINTFTEQFGRRTGMVSGFLLAISPFSIYYAQEGRMYTLTALLVLATYHVLLQLREEPRRKSALALLAVLGVAGMYTHYYYALALLSLALTLTFEHRRNLKPLLPVYGAFLIIGLCFLPWLGVVINIIGGEGQHFRRFTASVLPYTLFRFGAGYALMPLNYGSKETFIKTALAHWPELLGYLSVFGISAAFGIYILWRNYRRDSLFFLTPLLLPALLALLISLFTPMLSERYLIVSYPFFIALLALVLHSKRRVARLLFISCAALFLLGTTAHYSNPNFGNTQWREATGYIGFRAGTCQVALVNPDYLLGTVNYYLPSSWSLHPVDTDRIEQLREVVGTQECPGFWLLERGTADSVLNKFLTEDFTLAREHQFPLENGVSVYYLERR